jgi:hypothetical protein
MKDIIKMAIKDLTKYSKSVFIDLKDSEIANFSRY